MLDTLRPDGSMRVSPLDGRQTDIRSFSLDLLKKTVVQLRAIAKDAGIKNAKQYSKAKLVIEIAKTQM